VTLEWFVVVSLGRRNIASFINNSRGKFCGNMRNTDEILYFNFKYDHDIMMKRNNFLKLIACDLEDL